MNAYSVTPLPHPRCHIFRAGTVARGTIAPETEGWLVTVEGVAIYGRDTYDFANRDGEDQWLGRWDCEKGEWIQFLGFGTTVHNSDFEGYRQRTGQGGDFEIFPPLRELVLSQTYSTFCPARVHVP
jgi:hypothetical protein